MKKILILTLLAGVAFSQSIITTEQGDEVIIYPKIATQAGLDGKASSASLYSTTNSPSSGSINLTDFNSSVPLLNSSLVDGNANYRDVMLRGDEALGGARLQVGTGWWTTNAIGTTNAYGTVIADSTVVGDPDGQNYAHGDNGFWLQTSGVYDGGDGEGEGDGVNDQGVTLAAYALGPSLSTGKARGSILESPKWKSTRFTDATNIMEVFYVTPSGNGNDGTTDIGYGSGLVVTRQTNEDLLDGFRYRKDIGWYSLGSRITAMSITGKTASDIKPVDITTASTNAPYIGDGRVNVGVSSAAPSNPTAGDMYFDSDDSTGYMYTGTVWTNLY